MKKTFINDTLSRLFETLGKIIAQHPFYFIILPLCLSLLLSIGLFKIKYNEDLDYLFSSDKGEVYANKQFIEKMFPVNTSHFFDIMRMTQRPKAPNVYITSIYGENMLRGDILREIQIFDQMIRNVTITVQEKLITYNQLCGIVNEKCFENPISAVLNNIDDVTSGKKRYQFPMDMDNFTFTYKEMLLNFGGVKTDANGFMKVVKAIRLLYPVDETNTNKKDWIKEWRKKVFQCMNDYHFKFIDIYPCPLYSTELEIEILADKITPLFAAAIAIVGTFCLMTFMTNDWNRSKPGMGIASIVSAGLAVTTSFGLLGIFGVESVKFNIILPFLVLATEIDDAFVIIACWRITNPRDNVEKRMGKTYSKCAVSITITTVTNLVSYCIAMTAEFPSVRIFCFYGATCIFFTYFFQITFFGGCLALSGYREEKNFHISHYNAISESEKTANNSVERDDEDIFMKFFRDKVSEVLSHSITKIFIIFLYFVNLGIGIWGILSLNEGFNVFTFYPQDSKITKSFQIYYENFAEYAYTLQIIVNQTLDYSDSQIQKSIDDLMKQFEQHPNIAGSDLEISWLKYYQIFQHHPISKYSLSYYNLSNKQDFIDGLRYVFLKIKSGQQFSKDIVFNQNYTEIKCSRFFLIAKNVSDRATEFKMITDMSKMAEESRFSVIIHSYISSVVEQGIIIRQVIFQLFWLMALLVFVVFIAFIPNFLCAAIVAVSVISITVETVGYMSLFGVNLDVISMLSLILSVGFCVNYPTHISYAFLYCSNMSVKEKLKISLHHVGFSMLQGLISTILGVIIFLYNNMYIYVTFVKIVGIISFQSVFHALLVIPVFLTVITSCRKQPTVHSRTNEYDIATDIS